jgi:hypothetical protein
MCVCVSKLCAWLIHSHTHTRSDYRSSLMSFNVIKAEGKSVYSPGVIIVDYYNSVRMCACVCVCVCVCVNVFLMHAYSHTHAFITPHTHSMWYTLSDSTHTHKHTHTHAHTHTHRALCDS